MTANRSLGFLLVAVQAAAMAYLSESPTFSVLTGFVALVGWISSMRWSLDRLSERRLMLLIVVAFVAKHMILPQTFRAMAVSFATPLAYAVAQCLLTLQVLQFFMKRPHDRLPNWLPGLGAMTLACAANVIVRPQERVAAQAFVIAYVSVAALYCISCHRRLPIAGKHQYFTRAFAVSVLLATGMGGGWVASEGLFKNARGLEDLLGWVANSPAGDANTGFSGKARLDSVRMQKDLNSDQIAVRVYSADAPGYLRGRVFDQYESGEWVAPPGSRALTPAEELPAAMSHHNERETVFAALEESTYAGVRSQLEQGQLFECWPDTSLAGHIFAPVGTTHFQADTRSVTINSHGILESSDLPGGFPYSVYAIDSPPVEAPAALDREQLLAIPGTLDPRVRQLAAHLFAECRTTNEKIDAVETYFVTNYEYQMGITIPRGEEPLNYFLLKKPPAHCEYFAAGAAILLRLGGVPTRYVTGFVVEERNELDNCWVARNREAHAWVEAFDDTRGWVLVEATPASGQPKPQQASAIQQFWEQLRHRLTMFRFRFDQGGMQWLFAALWPMIAGVPGIILGVIVAFLAIAFAIRRMLRKRSAAAIDPRVAALQAMLAKMDSRLARRLKLQRQPGETLHQFARRIRQAAEIAESSRRERNAQSRAKPQHDDFAQWYEKYASIRYGGNLDDASIAELTV